jgi:hypothetical protein
VRSELAGRLVHVRARRDVLGDLHVPAADQHDDARADHDDDDVVDHQHDVVNTCGNGMVDPGEPAIRARRAARSRARPERRARRSARAAAHTTTLEPTTTTTTDVDQPARPS